jgi:hypothetical protein
MPYVFDDFVIQDTPGHVLATLARPIGPIEDGSFDSTQTWELEGGRQRVVADGFGIDPSGNPYFDTLAVDPGDHAILFVDPTAVTVWLEAA